MKKKYQLPQIQVMNMVTGTPLQGSGLPSYIQDPGMSSTPSGNARAAESTIWDDPEEETRKAFNDDEEEYE